MYLINLQDLKVSRQWYVRILFYYRDKQKADDRKKDKQLQKSDQTVLPAIQYKLIMLKCI